MKQMVSSRLSLLALSGIISLTTTAAKANPITEVILGGGAGGVDYLFTWSGSFPGEGPV